MSIRSGSMRLKAFFLRVAVASIVANAAVAILALIAGDFGEFEGRVLATTVSVSVASLLLMACMAGYEARRLAGLPVTGAFFVFAGLTLILGGIWSDGPTGDYWCSTASAISIAAAIAYVSLLSLFDLDVRYRWLRLVAYGLTGLLVIEALIGIWELGPEFEDAGWRIIGVTGVLFAASTILVLVLQRAGRAHGQPSVDSPAFCPACGAAINTSGGEGR